jgi:hypothetical protein
LDNNNVQSSAQDKNGFNDLINELIKINQPLTAPQANRMRSGKDRAHSEKTGVPPSTAGVNSQAYNVQNPTSIEYRA